MGSYVPTPAQARGEEEVEEGLVLRSEETKYALPASLGEDDHRLYLEGGGTPSKKVFDYEDTAGEDSFAAGSEGGGGVVLQKSPVVREGKQGGHRIPPLSLGGMTGITDKSTAGKSTQAAQGRIGVASDNGKGGGLGLNLANVKKVDFHDEFMSRINECSESWREAAMRECRFNNLT